MMLRMLLPILLSTCTLSGCVSFRAVLVNEKGEYLTCANTSAGITGSIVAQIKYDNCVKNAKEKGYRIESQQ